MVLLVHYLSNMGRAEKLLARMRDNPKGDWRIEDFKNVARALEVEWNHEGTSHVVFRSPDGAHVSVPAKRPIKPVYVKLFIALIHKVEKHRENP